MVTSVSRRNECDNQRSDAHLRGSATGSTWARETPASAFVNPKTRSRCWQF